MLSTSEKFSVLKKTRQIAAKSLQTVLAKALKAEKVSEKDFKDNWLNELGKNQDIFSSGWYDPPLDGISVLFGDEQNLSRVSPKNIRPEEFWPKENIYLNKNSGLAFLYASPVDMQTGIIGDFGLSIYLGKNPKIIDHFKKSYQSVLEIFESIEVGMKFKDIAEMAKQILSRKNLFSNLSSLSDSTGTNIGHTIVGITPSWDEQDLKTAHSDWDTFKELIRKKRIFVNQVEEFEVKPGIAFTLEPRPEVENDPTVPMVYFHFAVLMHEDGRKELLNEFEEIFKQAGIDYLY